MSILKKIIKFFGFSKEKQDEGTSHSKSDNDDQKGDDNMYNNEGDNYENSKGLEQNDQTETDKIEKETPKLDKQLSNNEDKPKEVHNEISKEDSEKGRDKGSNKPTKEKSHNNTKPKTTDRDTEEHGEEVIEKESEESDVSIDEGESEEEKVETDVKNQDKLDENVLIEYLSSIIILQNFRYLKALKNNINKPNLNYLNQVKILCLLDDRVEINSQKKSYKEYIKLGIKEDVDVLIQNFHNSVRDILSKHEIFLNDSKVNEIFDEILNFLFYKNLSEADLFLKIVNSPKQRIYEDFFNLLFDFLCDNVNEIFYQDKDLHGKLYRIKENSDKDWMVISDLHGDREALVTILQKEKIFTKTDKNIVFLGDYIDRGTYQPWVLLGVLILKYFYPDRIYMLRGNHEYLRRNKNDVLEHTISDSGYPDSLFVNFWHDKMEIIDSKVLEKINNFFENLPGLIKLGKTLIVHAGIPRNDGKYDDFEFKEINSFNYLNNDKLLKQMHWSDPKNGPYKIQAGTRFQFGVEQFERFMDIIDCNIMIRGHEQVAEGYQLLSDYNNRLITLFSTGNNPNSDKDNCYIGYASVKPCYGIIKGDQTILIKRVFEENIVKEMRITNSEMDNYEEK